MGKGDKRTRKGKIYAGSYGNVRPQGAVSRAMKPAAPVVAAPRKPAAPVKKAAAKKA